MDSIKNEYFKGTGVYVFMPQSEKQEWDKYRAVGHAFTLVDKLRSSVPQNIKWVDKNVHKVIQSAIELYQIEQQRAGSTQLDSRMINIVTLLEQMAKDI